MTITTPDQFRQIGIQEGKRIAAGHSSAHMMFEPEGGPGHIAYLNGVIDGLRLSLPDEGRLQLSVTREVEAKEIPYMVFGTGALSYPWWGRVDWISIVDDEEFPIEGYDFDVAEPTDVLVIRHDTEGDDEGTMKGKTRLTFQQIVDAAASAIGSGHLYDKDAQEDLGMCDSEQADVVLQLAVFGKLVFG